VKAQTPKPALSQSSTSSLQIEGKSKTELKELARQLMIQVSQMGEDEDEENNSPASSEASSSSKQVKKKDSQPDPFYQDAQDQYEAYNLDSE
jgi:hypothetical protein